MDKSIGRDKRRKNQQYKKPPPVKSGSTGSGKSQKGSTTTNQTAVPTTTTTSASAPLIVYDDPYSRRPIEPNWTSSRDLPSPAGESSDSEDEQLRAADFEKLLQMPPSVSGHFFLSTEKHWTTEESGEEPSGGGNSGQYFQIDTKQLNASLATIPFYERNGYPCDIFSKNEIDSQKLKAQLESEKYDKLLRQSESARRMGDNQPKQPPVKCLIGSGALPPRADQEQRRPDVPPAAIVRPPPCLMGPMSLPPELRNDPNVTGSYAASASNAATTVVTERLNEVNLSGGGGAGNHSTMRDAVPIGGSSNEQDHGTSGETKKGNISGAKGSGAKSTTAGKETKEDIQQWLDDILDM